MVSSSRFSIVVTITSTTDTITPIISGSLESGITFETNNNGIFKNVIMVEEDADLVKYSNSLITKAGITNIKSVQNRSIEEPSPRTDGYDEIVSKQYDVIIATLPFSDQAHGIYHLKQQERTLRKEIQDRNYYEGGHWPFQQDHDQGLHRIISCATILQYLDFAVLALHSLIACLQIFHLSFLFLIYHLHYFQVYKILI